MRLRNILILLVVLLALGGVFYYIGASQPVEKPEPKLFVWLVEMEELERIEIQLPREGESQAFVKEADRSWSFDDPQRTDVDMQRWGGGIPLLLSGPGADRVIAENATEEQLTVFGLTEPKMRIVLNLLDEDVMTIDIGDSAPDGHAYYVRAPDSNDVALVDYTWYDVLERLVKEPPYVPAAEENGNTKK